jgi:iron complex transport system ATP-binding protein
MVKAALKVENLGFSYFKEHTIFSEVSLELEEGRILTILGANGAGKSTLLNCLAGLLRPKTGAIYLNGRNALGMSFREIATFIAYVPQIQNPTYSYPVREYVVMGRTPYIGAFAMPRKADYEMAEKALARFNLTHLMEKPYTEISSGERQMAAIARAITQEPKIIMLDEPTAHLDYGNQMRAIKLIRSLAEEGYAVIFTTHVPDHPLFLCGEVSVFQDGNKGNDGKTVAVGEADSILTDEALSALYSAPVKTVRVGDGRRICYTQ